MKKKQFLGFPSKSGLTPIPNLFFTTLLPKISDLAELKLLLHIFWLLYQKKSQPKFVTFEELLTDGLLMEGIKGEDDNEGILRSALEAAVERGVLLHLALDRDSEQQELYFINSESNRRTVARLRSGEISLDEELSQDDSGKKEEKPNIFVLYEENIGLLTPMIVEELKAAEEIYPASWIEEAFKEAVSLNKLNWRYISRILENWSSEGKDSGKSRRNSKKERDPDGYIKGKYGHLVKR